MTTGLLFLSLGRTALTPQCAERLSPKGRSSRPRRVRVVRGGSWYQAEGGKVPPTLQWIEKETSA